jgi:hypothetical protein
MKVISLPWGLDQSPRDFRADNPVQRQQMLLGVVTWYFKIQTSEEMRLHFFTLSL